MIQISSFVALGISCWCFWQPHTDSERKARDVHLVGASCGNEARCRGGIVPRRQRRWASRQVNTASRGTGHEKSSPSPVNLSTKRVPHLPGFCETTRQLPSARTSDCAPDKCVCHATTYPKQKNQATRRTTNTRAQWKGLATV